MRRTGLVSGVAFAALAATAGSAQAAKASACRASVSASLASHDPTAIEDLPVAKLSTRTRGAMTGVQLRLTRNGKTVASSKSVARIQRGTHPVDLRLKRGLTRGGYRLVTTGKLAGCAKRFRVTRTWKLDRPSLPVRVAIRGRSSEGGATVVSVVLRAVGGKRPAGVRVALQDRSGKQLATTTVAGALSAATDVRLRAEGDLAAGSYDVVVSGRTGGATAKATQAVVLGKSSSPVASVASGRQKAVVDWSGGNSSGRDVVGVALPGIGYGELVCTADTQWIRVFPSDPRREISMMNWIYRDWRTGNGKAIREGLHTQFTGADFSERLAEFLPAEKQATGEFIGLISERGTIGGPGDGPFAPPTSLRLTWEWDFATAGSERCHAELELVSQTADAGGPAVSSAQVVWRGDAAAAGRTTAATDVPGVGPMTVVCEAGPDGQRTITLGTARGARTTVRESTWDSSVPQGAGPIVARLPNNGQLQIDLDGGGRVLVSSRWKENDPDPTANFCAVSAQAISPS